MNSADKIIKGILIKRFGKQDVLLNHSDKRYPLGCKYYVKSKDLFIETFMDDAPFSYHWFSKRNKNWRGNNYGDEEMADEWRLSNNTKLNDRYIEWTNTNLRKRKDAKANNLNYFVCWDNNQATDFLLYDALDYPEAKDWKMEFSWLKKIKLKKSGAYYKLPEGITRTNVNCYQIVKNLQQDAFFHREFELFNNNNVCNKGRWQGVVLSHCYKYLNKLPKDIKQEDIYLQIGKSLFVDKYSLFDNEPLINLIDKYNIQSIANPCAGFGERILTCKYKDIDYVGMDINIELEEGYKKIIDNYNIEKQKFILGDCAKTELKDYNAECVLFTPPYWNREVYSSIREAGENQETYDEYLDWFKRVLESSIGDDTKYIAYTMFQYYGKDHEIEILSDTSSIIEKLGWKLIEQTPLNSKKRVKMINTEYLSVYEKI